MSLVSVGELSECSPALRQDSPGVSRLRGAGLTLHRQGAKLPGLHVRLPPCPFTVSGPLPATIALPSLVRFLAAFTSRSRTRPHIAVTYVRSDRASLAFTAPHPEQVLLDGNRRSTTTAATIARRLVLQLSADLPKRSIRDMPGQTAVSEHPSNEQVFDNNGPVLPGQACCELMDAILALVGDPARSLTQGGSGLAPTVRRGSALLRRRVVRADPAGRRPGQFADLAQRTTQGRGLGICSAVERTARVLMPRSTPTTASGTAGVSTGRYTWMVNDTNQRPRSNPAAADITSAVPASTVPTSPAAPSWA